MTYGRFRRGDTIIEVMLAMAVIGLILSAAYATTSKNLQTSRYTQERTEALKIAEGQIELMKSLSSDEKAKLYSHSGTFCIDPTTRQVFGTDGTNVICTSASQALYSFLIDRRADNETFAINVLWTPPGGSDSNQAIVKLLYRYPQ